MVRKKNSAWFDDFVARARANNEIHSGSRPEYREVTAAIARSLTDDALELAIAKYGEIADPSGWRTEARPILVTERERRNRVRQKRTAWIAFVTLIAAAAAVAVPFLIRD